MSDERILPEYQNGERSNAWTLLKLAYFVNLAEINGQEKPGARFIVQGGEKVVIPMSETLKLRGFALGSDNKAGLDPLTQAFNAYDRGGHLVRIVPERDSLNPPSP